MNKIEKCKTTQIGRIVIHKDEQEKRIYQNELNYFLENGWELGISEKHRIKTSQSKMGQKPWNKGVKGSIKPNSTSFEKGHIPWNKGVIGCQISWCKGLTKETDERVSKISQSKIGHQVSIETRKRLHDANIGKRYEGEKLKRKIEKSYLTKKSNNSLNTSNEEEIFYENLILENQNKTIFRQYYDAERYPFNCDFYIKEDDLFIELNKHWTHGGKPYNPNNEECQKQLREWEEKAKTSQFYKNAIETWTIRDVNKLKYAKENNLNYNVIY